RQQQIETPTADQQATDSPKRDQQQRFDQVIPYDRQTARAQSETDRDFALSGGSPNELQTGDVGAGNEKHEDRSADDQEQSFPVIPDDLVPQWTQIKVPAFVEFRIALHQPGRDRRKLRLSGGNRKAGLEPAEHS